MTIENIEKTLQSAITNGNLLLDKTAIDSENIRFLFKEFLSNDPLNVKTVELKTESENIIAKGKASLFSIPDIEVEIKFYFKDQKPQIDDVSGTVTKYLEIYTKLSKFRDKYSNSNGIKRGKFFIRPANL